METDIVYRNESGVAVTTSYLVAETFGKAHKRVLEDIDRLGCSDGFREPNFGLSLKLRELPNGGHKEERFYVITKDGFTLLAMGYTGKKAMLFKEKYIAAFNATGNINDLARQAQDMEASATTDNSVQMAEMQATMAATQQALAQLTQVLAGGIKANINMYGEDGMYKSMKKAEKYAGRVGYK